MGSNTARFFHEHVLVKEPGTREITPWHHDQPYYCVDGDQSVSFWVPARSGPGVGAASSSSPARTAGGAGSSPAASSTTSPTPTADEPLRARARPRRRASDRTGSCRSTCEPGDVIAFHFRTLHDAPGTEGLPTRAGCVVPVAGRRRHLRAAAVAALAAVRDSGTSPKAGRSTTTASRSSCSRRRWRGTGEHRWPGRGGGCGRHPRGVRGRWSAVRVIRGVAGGADPARRRLPGRRRHAPRPPLRPGPPRLDAAARTVAHTAGPPVVTETSQPYLYHLAGTDGPQRRIVLAHRDGQEANLGPGIVTPGPGQVLVPDWYLPIGGVKVGDRLDLTVPAPVVLDVDNRPLPDQPAPTTMELTVVGTYPEIPVRPEPSYWCGLRAFLRPNNFGDPPLPLALVAPETLSGRPLRAAEPRLGAAAGLARAHPRSGRAHDRGVRPPRRGLRRRRRRDRPAAEGAQVLHVRSGRRDGLRRSAVRGGEPDRGARPPDRVRGVRRRSSRRPGS